MPLIIALSHSFTSSLYLPPPTHQLSIFSFLFEVIIASWDTFMTFILLGTSLPFLSLSSSLSLSVNYPCSLICRHPSNLRFPVMNQVPPFSSVSSSVSLSPPLPPLPISAKQLTNWLALINRETHA